MRSTLYTNGSILTMEPGPRPEALLVTDGRIAALGGAATLSALAPDAERRDLAGGALLPAFLDAHSHITALAATMGLCDLSPSTSLHHMADILWTFEEDTDPPADGWILGFGYDHTALAERAHPGVLTGSPVTDLKITLVAGGYPLFVNGKIAGGIGVGGGTEEQDCAIAEYVVSVFEELTK